VYAFFDRLGESLTRRWRWGWRRWWGCSTGTGKGKVARWHGEQHTWESPSRAEQISSDLGQRRYCSVQYINRGKRGNHARWQGVQDAL